MSGRDERLRQLLRDADPAREAPELGADDVARLRRTVLSAGGREERPWSVRPSFALVLGAAMAAVVLGLAFWRFGLTWKSTTSKEDHAATSLPTQTPSGHRDARPSTTQAGSPTASAGSATASTTTPASPSLAAPSATTAHADLASAHRDTTSRGPRTGTRPSPRATGSAPEDPIAETAPPETIAAAQPPSEPQQPYQLQLTAPGGTRIVWLLTSSSGR